jgi:hypothetical protein
VSQKNKHAATAAATTRTDARAQVFRVRLQVGERPLQLLLIVSRFNTYAEQTC